MGTFGHRVSEETKRKLSIIKTGKPLLGEGVAIRNYALLEYTSNCRKRGLVWALPRDIFLSLIQEACYYCGSPPSRSLTKPPRTGELLVNGVDRLDNTVGYTVDNSVSCCALCNRCKSDMSVDAFSSYIRKIAKHFERLHAGNFNRDDRVQTSQAARKDLG